MVPIKQLDLKVSQYIILLLLVGMSHLMLGQDQPNFVIFIGDDISRDDLGAYGNDSIRTPNIDKLALEGIKFNNAYLTISSCSPSRCSILTGRYPHNTGAAELHTQLPEGQHTFVEDLKDAGYYTVMSGKTHVGPVGERGFTKISKGKGPGWEEQWVDDLKERPKDKPFFMWYAASDAHHVWTDNEFGYKHDMDDIDVPIYHPDVPATRADYIGYYNEVSRFDYYIGEVVNELKAQGELENTFIIVMADNGRPFPRDKTRLYDSGIKTPFVVYAPFLGLYPGEREQLISSIDIAPTILDLAGLDVPESVQGISFDPVLSRFEKIRDYVFAERNWHVYEAHERMVRYGHWVYIRNRRPQFDAGHAGEIPKLGTYKAMVTLNESGQLLAPQNDLFIKPRPEEELYYILRDPDQTVNLIKGKKVKKVLNQLRAILDRWENETADSAPANLTPDRWYRDRGEDLPGEFKRGTMPGSDKGAEKVNAKGPVLAEVTKKKK